MREWLKNLVTEAARDIGSELKHMASHGSHSWPRHCSTVPRSSCTRAAPTRIRLAAPQQAQIEEPGREM